MTKKRMNDIQQQMTVPQLVRQHCRDFMSNDTFEEFIPWMLDDKRMIEVDQIHEAVRKIADQYKEQPIKRRQVFQEYYTLSNLVSIPGIEVESERYRWKYELMRIGMVQTWCLHHMLKPEHRQTVQEHLEQIMVRHWKVYCELRGFIQAVETIQTTYLQGEVILLVEQRDFLNQLLDDLASYRYIMEELFDILNVDDETDRVINPSNVDEIIQQFKRAWLTKLKQRVAIKVMESLGEDKRALQQERQWMRETYEL